MAAGPPTGRLERYRARRPIRVLLGAFGDPGHAFPMIALGRALAARGHEVTLQTWERWKAHVEREGLVFAPAPEYTVFPSGPEPLDFYDAVVHATRDTQPLLQDVAPEVVVADILTLAPALAAERQGVPLATLIPHVHPHGEPHFPIYSLGARMPRTAVGRAFWRRVQRPVVAGLELGRRELNRTRARLGLPALARVHGGISQELALVATFPQLEYPRPWPEQVHLVGPLMWEPPEEQGAAVERWLGGGRFTAAADNGRRRERPDAGGLPSPGEGAASSPGKRQVPLVLIAPSTAQDPEHRLLRAALRGLADAPVRVLATYNRRLPRSPLSLPANATVVEWVVYSQTMPRCDVVVCHGGHGTLVRALASGCPVVACPAVGDMNENAARLDWSGAGVRVPRRFVSPRMLRLAVERVLADGSMAERAGELAAWAGAHDAGAEAARLVERLAERRRATSAGLGRGARGPS